MTIKDCKTHISVIDAWANGADVQYLDKNTNKWVNTDTPQFLYNTEYRIKPFIYPIWFKYNHGNTIVRFDNLNTYEIVNSI